jgi:type II restriction/modification system DNA methylase subunit YeeA
VLNGEPVEEIHPDLTSGADTTEASVLPENSGICFMGTTKIGAFDLDRETARRMLGTPVNPNGCPNSDVIRPWVNAMDITRRPRGKFIIDFGTEMSEREAALYEMPFQYVKAKVYPDRKNNNRPAYREKWWLFGEPRPAMRKALTSRFRYIATPLVSKHRIFVWLPKEVVAENLINVFARDDDYFFGVLHSRVHEVWALTMGTQLEDRPRYTPSSTFETFPLPWPPGQEPKRNPRFEAIAAAARELVRLRDNWLNPPHASDGELKMRTLTNLYNQRPAWLDTAHGALDRSVFAAYGWSHALDREEILRHLLALNYERATAQPLLRPVSPPKKAPQSSALPMVTPGRTKASL